MHRFFFALKKNKLFAHVKTKDFMQYLESQLCISYKTSTLISTARKLEAGFFDKSIKEYIKMIK